MARKVSNINMAALEEEDELREKIFTQGAHLLERGNTSKVGRPRVEVRANKAMTVYFTKSERKVMKAYCNRKKFSSIVKQLLYEKGIL